ncbi:hypothetical protein [Micromonospora sp. RV43]|uniref:hypothetical protein n=1 Tax=Micromonospora sp. RV43 TaxID=1661387 RepID=UPI00064BADFD|nr:hypothetical protein [Micromonospora sp. RV43]
MRPDDELQSLIDSRRQAARELPGWRSAPERLLTLLQHATRLRAMEIAQARDSDVPWESVLAQIITWHHEIPVGQGPCEDVEAADICLAALEATRLDNLRGTLRAGGYEVRRRGEAFRIRHRWNPAVEAADAFLEHAIAPANLPGITSVERAWIRSRPRASRELPPADVLRAAAQRAKTAVDAYRHALPEGNLPDSFQLDGGLTVGQVADVLSAVMGFASLCEAAARMLKRTETTLASLRRTTLLEMTAELLPTVSTACIDAIIERLTYASGRSCRVSPLAKLEDTIIVCPPLITPRVIDAIILRSSAYDPGRYGPVGQRQGNRAVKWKDWLGQIPGVLVADRIRARRQDRRTAGDLDVVAVDPSQRRGLCLEIKWPIDAISLPEVTKIEDWVSSAATQVNRLRTELTSGSAVVEMPKGWPAFPEISWTWAVATPQQLCLRPLPFDEIYATSFRYMASHGKPRSLNDVIDTLTCPDLPVDGVDFKIDTIDFLLGRQKVVLVRQPPFEMSLVGPGRRGAATA